MEREPTDGAREQLDAAEDARPTTSRTGGGGEPYDDADTASSRSGNPGVDDEIDDAVIGQPGSGGLAAGIVGAPPDADVPDPLGRDDDEGEVDRRAR